MLPGKKRKLTFAEKETERALKLSAKEAKDRAKAEEAQKKEQAKFERLEEKRRRDEEKEAAQRVKEIEKAEKQRAKEAREAEKKAKGAERKAHRDAEKQAKEEAQRLKEEAKEKKERSQMRLGAFFQTTSTSADPSRSPSRRSSLVSYDAEVFDEGPAKASPLKKADAKNAFLPFFVQRNVEMAPVNRYWSDPNLSHMAAAQMDTWMKQDNQNLDNFLQTTFGGQKRNRLQKPRRTVKEIVERIRGASDAADLKQAAGQDSISDVPYKVLSFGEDVRPPYTGTYTRSVSPKSALRISRQPTARLLPDTNYDEDSEAEWEPPNEDDEDLISGDDLSDGGDDGDEDMDGFLDDEGDTSKRKMIVDLQPISSGLCWQSSQGGKGPLDEYRMQPVSDEIPFPIDPFATMYWPQPGEQVPKMAASSTSTNMHPPRVPLSNLNPNASPGSTPPGQTILLKGKEHPQGTIAQMLHGPAQKTTLATVPSKPMKLASAEVMPAFRHAVEGSELTKAGLVEVLKKQ